MYRLSTGAFWASYLILLFENNVTSLETCWNARLSFNSWRLHSSLAWGISCNHHRQQNSSLMLLILFATVASSPPRDEAASMFCSWGKARELGPSWNHHDSGVRERRSYTIRITTLGVEFSCRKFIGRNFFEVSSTFAFFYLYIIPKVLVENAIVLTWSFFFFRLLLFRGFYQRYGSPIVPFYINWLICTVFVYGFT